MKLYLVHCGFYDMEICDGVYESHVNLLIVASSFEEAKKNIRENPEFKKKKMHVDGLQEISTVDGYRIEPVLDPFIEGKTIITSSRHRDFGKISL